MNKEKLPKLVDVYRSSNSLARRQLPLIVDESLTLVMDVRGSGLICDNPLMKGKELEDFTRKWDLLTDAELKAALQITKLEMMNVLNQNVPCVGCRRSVERLYYQLFKFGHLTLDPLIVNGDGSISIREEKQTMPQVLGTIFHDHSIRLVKLIENQPKRNKKSLRCLLHSLDSQRSRPLTSVWRDVWDCMKPDCKKDVCIIEAPTLHATLETYLRKHRFCGECRTKVLKAYSLLMDEPEPCKEKGYVSSLYSGIKRCHPDKHIHLQTKTDYITNLISRAEPELLGSRRERHAKTLEIAQEEVLTCLGICMYERLHRIYMRMREEECTCQVFAAVVVDTLSRSFETAVERKQGISQLELLYAELAKEEQLKEIRRQQKKIKRKRKKANNNKVTDIKENCDDCDDEKEEYDKDCSCTHTKNNNNNNNINNNNNSTLTCYNNCVEILSSSTLKNNCNCDKDNTLECRKTIWIDDECKCEDTEKDNIKKNLYKCNYLTEFKKENNGSSSDHSHDCGYSSENNNGCCETGSLISSISSSPEGSELACSDTCCHHDDYIPHCRVSDGRHTSLQDMLEGCSDDDDDDCNSKLTPEEVWEFKNNNKQIHEKRQQLREALKKKFIEFCIYGPLQVPRLLIQSKYASN